MQLLTNDYVHQPFTKLSKVHTVHHEQCACCAYTYIHTYVQTYVCMYVYYICIYVRTCVCKLAYIPFYLGYL